MAEPKLEQVFKKSGIPTFTFVKPVEYERLIVSLRTPGRGVIIEGPSGIGKSTSVDKALEELGLAQKTRRLSARKSEDRRIIAELPQSTPIGIVVVDDFHRLDDAVKHAIADFLKTLADEEPLNSKLVLVGINKVAESLINIAPDLNDRIETIHFGTNPDDRVLELITRGEEALNIIIDTKNAIATDARGSFSIAQMLCNWTCIIASVLERCDETMQVPASLEVVKEKVLHDLAGRFLQPARKFATGPRLRMEGRAPYLHILHWLSQADDWTLQLDHALAKNPTQRASVGQIIEKGYLRSFLMDNPQLNDVIHYDPTTRIIAIEDPKFLYFLRNLIWSKFARDVGFITTKFKAKYDFALSFAGADRSLAKMIYESLTEAEAAVFYDKNEQHRILAENVEDYLAPIYRSEAEFVIALLGLEYPKRVWTKFESSQFKQRFGEYSVIAIWYSDVPVGMFDESARFGGFTFDRSISTEDQVREIVELLMKKLLDLRAGIEEDLPVA